MNDYGLYVMYGKLSNLMGREMNIANIVEWHEFKCFPSSLIVHSAHI